MLNFYILRDRDWDWIPLGYTKKPETFYVSQQYSLY
jgi:hypothetical protein